MTEFGIPGITPGYVVSGLLVGVLVGLTGVGGGSLMTPLLVLVFGFHPCHGRRHRSAVRRHYQKRRHHHPQCRQERRLAHRRLDWRQGSIPATILTLIVIGQLGTTSKAVTSMISLVLGVALLLSAVSLIVKDRVLAIAIRRNPDFGLRTSIWMTVLVGFVVGVVVSISSVGAGAIGTIALLFLYPRLPVSQNRRFRHRACRAPDALSPVSAIGISARSIFACSNRY